MARGVVGLAAALSLWASPLTAQSVVAGSVEGLVTSVAGSPLRAASVTLVEARTGLNRQAASGSGGSFSFTFIVAGEYDLRVEALGYRPQLMQGIILGPGETVRLTIQLPAEPPPVTRVDTVRYAAGGGGAWPGLGHRVTARDVDERPAVRFGLAPLVSLSSQADAWGGFQGEAPGASIIFSDGEPFRAARHPGGTAGDVLLGSPFPRTGVSGLDILQGMEDIEWNARGASIPVRTRPRGGAGGGAYGLGSSGPMWNATAVEDQPSLTSLWGGGEVSLALVPDTAVLSLAVEGGRIQTAQPPSPSDSILAQLLSDGDVGTGVNQLTMVSAMGRVDWGLTNGGQVSARAGFGTFERTLDRAQGPGLGYGVAMPAKGTDASVSAVVATPLQDPFFLEVRGSLGYSDREYEPDASLPAAFVVGPRARVGPDPSAPASVSRLDVGGGPVLHYRSGPHRLKAGARVDFSSFDYTFADASLGSYRVRHHDGRLPRSGELQPRPRHAGGDLLVGHGVGLRAVPLDGGARVWTSRRASDISGSRCPRAMCDPRPAGPSWPACPRTARRTSSPTWTPACTSSGTCRATDAPGSPVACRSSTVRCPLTPLPST